VNLCYHGFSETPGDVESCQVCVEIRDLKQEADDYRAMLWVLAREAGLSLHIQMADLRSIPEGSELLVWHEELFDSMMLKGICSPSGEGKPVSAFLRETKPKTKPKIITLCGPTRFTSEMLKEAWRLTITGVIVIHWNILESKEAFSHGAEAAGGNVKDVVDALYLHKVAMADEVRVINVGGYIGESTRAELRHARKLGKPITWLESDKVDKEFA
jgi:hypothetical protein